MVYGRFLNGLDDLAYMWRHLRCTQPFETPYIFGEPKYFSPQHFHEKCGALSTILVPAILSLKITL